MANHNAVDFQYLLNPECSLSIMVSAISFSIVFFLVYYILGPRAIFPFYAHVEKDRKLYWKIIDRFISMIHSLLILILIIIFSKGGISLSLSQEIVDSYTTKEERMIFSISIGYFIYDIIVNCIIYSKKYTNKIDYMYIFHHVITISLLSMITIAVYAGYTGIMVLFFSEITAPLLHFNSIRQRLMDRSTKSKHLIDFMFKVLYLILYVVFRFIIIGRVIYRVLYVFSNTPVIVLTGFAILYSMYFILFPSVCIDLRRVYSKYVKETGYSAVDHNQVLNTINLRLSQSDEDHSHSEYKQVLKLTEKSIRHVFVSGAIYSFFHTNRMSIYLLYAEEFNPSNFQITLLLSGYNIWCGIAAILYCSIANQYGYDMMLIILLFLQSIAVFLESIATNFYVLFTGIMVGQVAITYVVLAYIAWILPEKQAKSYTSYFYAVFVSFYLLGPLCAGLTSFFLSNRSVFIINFILCVCALFHAFIFVFKKQKQLETQQLRIGLVSQKNDDEQFPQCLEQLETEEHGEIETGCYDTAMVLLIIIINATVNVGESSFILYYALYVVQEMKGDIVIATGQLCFMAFNFSLSSLIARKWFDTKYKYWTMMIALSILMVSSFYLYPHSTLLNMYWIYAVCFGFPLGLYSMVSEMILLEIQPTKHSGKINGAKGLTANIGTASALLVISLYWDTDHNSFYYVTGAGFGIAWLLTIGMMIMKHIHVERNAINVNDNISCEPI